MTATSDSSGSTAPSGGTAPSGTAPSGSTAQRDRAGQAAGDLPSAGRAGAWAMVLCLGSSLLLLFLASLAEGSLIVERVDGRETVVSPTTVIVTVMLSVIVGTILLGTLGRRSRRAWMSVAVLGLVIGLGTTVAPLTARGEPLTTAVLVAMHVACAVAWFTVLTVMLRRNR